MKNMIKNAVILATTLVMAFAFDVHAQEARLDTLTQGLFIHTFVSAIGPTDPIIQRVIEGKEIVASPGSKVEFQNGKTETWTTKTADSAGWFKGDYLESGYGLFNIRSNRDRVALLEGMGNDMVYVNGVPMEGNKYSYKDTWHKWEPAFNFSILPIRLKQGNNQLLFVCSRGLLKVKMRYISPQVLFNVKRLTLPDLLVGEAPDYYGAITVINATDKPLRNTFIKAYNDSGYFSEMRVPLIQPMSIRKVAFKLIGPAPSAEGTVEMKLALLNGSSANASELANAEIPVNVLPPTVTHNVTFISKIDGSVQYYSIVPPRGPQNCKPKALFFSLHGADVIAKNQANSYYPKTWGYIVCPTNGGPYGYDWEDWGRLDALQVLHIAETTLNIDPSRVYLTGHSMGGHGTWIIGAQYPDKFAAIGPSAGWISWWTYVFRHDHPKTAMGKMLLRSTNQVRTYLLDKNFKQEGVYILQGSEDNNVPITESINMSDSLKKFDKDFVFHEEMGVGHWWGLGDEAGTDCVDWPPMFDYFARHARPGEQRILNIDFTTANPGVSAKDYWLTIYSQQKQLEPSRAIVRFIPSRNRFVGTTHNIKILSFSLRWADKNKPFRIDLDSTHLDSVSVPPYATRLWLENESGQWKVTSEPSPADKGPVRYGTFKDAFRHDMIFVYGTHGTREENKWAFDRARFDAEYFWYQGGGSVQIVSDREFNAEKDPNRNVILYGNEQTNSAWNKVLAGSPVTVYQGKILFGKKVIRGKDYSCFMVRPRKGSSIASVGVVAGTGIEGMRLTYIVPYLQPWFSLPDLTIMNASVFSRVKTPESKEQAKFESERGVKIAGFFGLDWSLKHGDFVEQ